MAINLLQPEIYNRISAGEVVEKPANVVKELIENSIDAGATSINVSIIGGGIEQIKVSDNGCGIDADDLKKAFLPHATSKIKNISDLDNIFTLGFRGEALPSIASVSKVQLTSKTEESETGKTISLIGGTVEYEEEKGCPTGTQIIVNNLFFNTPARYKFLRKPKQEENDITSLISRFILANPTISFTYSADGKLIYQNSQSDLKQAMYVVYGKECYDALEKIHFENEHLKVSGYICKPSFVKPNRTYQTLIVNGRYVNNQTVSTAVYNAFENYLMVGKFPVYVINVNIPYDEIDVNIHPAKMEVKFQNANEVFKAVYVAVKNALENMNTVYEYKTSQIDSSKFVNTLSQPPKQLEKNEGVSYQEVIQNLEQEKDNITQQIDELATSFTNLNRPISDVRTATISSNSSVLSEIYMDKINNLEEKKKEIENQLFVKANKFEQESLQLGNIEFNVIGKLFNTYIIIEKNSDCYIIDQHAGHERILFDLLYEQMNNKQLVVQPLLVPVIISVNYVEYDFLMTKKTELESLGFEINEFGTNTIKVTAVPQILSEINLQMFFNELLSEMNLYKTITSTDVLYNKLASKACKSAVKGGDDLKESEIQKLIYNMQQQTSVYLCPHGRPIIIKISKQEIEKLFKRIV